MKQKLTERLMRYARVNTASDPHSDHFPTNQRQKELALLLLQELKAIGVPEIDFDESACVLYAKIPANIENGTAANAVGFICHLDTSPEAASEEVKPWLLQNYAGGDIVLNPAQNIVMRAADFPNLQQYIGNDLILTDGATLGAVDI